MRHVMESQAASLKASLPQTELSLLGPKLLASPLSYSPMALSLKKPPPSPAPLPDPPVVKKEGEDTPISDTPLGGGASSSLSSWSNSGWGSIQSDRRWGGSLLMTDDMLSQDEVKEVTVWLGCLNALSTTLQSGSSFNAGIVYCTVLPYKAKGQ